MPSAGAVGALALRVANGIGGNAGVLLVFLAVVAIGATFYVLSRKTKVTPDNVNNEWKGTSPSAPPAARAGAGMNVLLAASSSWINFGALWKICVIGLICGAGLPALFAVGLRLLSLPAGPGRAPDRRTAANDDRIYFGNVPGAIGAGRASRRARLRSAWGSTGS